MRGRYIGIAPEANLVNVKVVGDGGVSYTSNVVNAIEWVIKNRQAYNIRVINLSLISSIAESAKTSTLDAAVERAWFNGIFVVVAAGNNGANTLLFPPANDPFVVTVGAADAMGTPQLNDDTVAPWSSYGTTQDGYAKPDVVAVGRYIQSVLAPNSYFGATFPARIVDTNYIMMSGTSMAAPVVAGIAALAFQNHPEWTNDQVKWLMTSTALKLGGTTPLVGQGAGEVQGQQVAQYAGIPALANQNIPINLQLIGPGGATVYTGTPLAPGSSWTTSSWTTSSWTTSSWTTSSWTTANWTTATSNNLFVW
ncbi:MAG: hypothetical protein NVS4B8_26580 [Herpetosiphon sp.]